MENEQNNNKSEVTEDLSGLDSMEFKLDDKGEPILEKDDSGDDKGGADDSTALLRKSIEDSYSDLSTPKSGKKDESKKDESFKLEIGDEKFFSGDEEALDKLVRDPAAFNGLLNVIFKKAVEVAHNTTTERSATTMPELIRGTVQQQLFVHQTVSDFYSENKDLIPFKKTVAAIAGKLAVENPDMPLPKLLVNAEKFARSRLQLPKQGADDKGNKDKKGAKFPKTPSGNRGSGKSGDDLTGQDKEFADMLSSVG